MKIRYALTILAILVFLGGAAQAQVLYGISHEGPNGPSTLHIIDQNSGAVSTIGPVGFERCGGMSFDALGNLFATCERSDGSDTTVLVQIDISTGAGTEVGAAGNCDNWTDVSFRNSDNELFASGFRCGPPGYQLTTISTGTGLSTIVGPLNNLHCCGGGLAYSVEDTLYFLDGEDPDEPPASTLYTVNQDTGDATVTTNVTYPPGLNRGPRSNAMAFNQGTGVLYLSVVHGGGNIGPPRENFLGILNIDTGVATILGPTANGLDAIAFTPVITRNVPTLSEWGLIAMAGVLGLIGLIAIRRRKAVI